MKATHIKMTLLEDLITGIDSSKKGTSNLWRIKEIMPHGTHILQFEHFRVALLKEEIEKGERHTESNLSFPLGIHLKLEKVYKPHWWSRTQIIKDYYYSDYHIWDGYCSQCKEEIKKIKL